MHRRREHVRGRAPQTQGALAGGGGGGARTQRATCKSAAARLSTGGGRPATPLHRAFSAPRRPERPAPPPPLRPASDSIRIITGAAVPAAVEKRGSSAPAPPLSTPVSTIQQISAARRNIAGRARGAFSAVSRLTGVGIKVQSMAIRFFLFLGFFSFVL